MSELQEGLAAILTRKFEVTVCGRKVDLTPPTWDDAKPVRDRYKNWLKGIQEMAGLGDLDAEGIQEVVKRYNMSEEESVNVQLDGVALCLPELTRQQVADLLTRDFNYRDSNKPGELGLRALALCGCRVRSVASLNEDVDLEGFTQAEPNTNSRTRAESQSPN